jgi:hypothetical protein
VGWTTIVNYDQKKLKNLVGLPEDVVGPQPWRPHLHDGVMTRPNGMSSSPQPCNFFTKFHSAFHTRATLEPQPVQRPKNSSPGFQPGLRGHFFGPATWMGWLGEGVGLPPATSHTARLGPWQLIFLVPPSNWGDIRA